MSDQEARDFIIQVFDGYKKRKLENRFTDDNEKIPQVIIELYYNCVQKPKFNIILNEYKKRYVYNESRVEKNITREEQEGMGIVYDYIESFDFNKENFNIFTSSISIHQKLYSKCIGSGFGGKLRDEHAVMNNTIIEVMPPVESKKYFNSFIANSKFIFEPLEKDDLLGYIDKCIEVSTDLIKAQPFADGNKRTFRALLSLMLKKINIPPFYIEENERREYKKYLLKAMEQNDDKLLKRFYYYKICDAIMELDINLSKFNAECMDNNIDSCRRQKK